MIYSDKKPNLVYADTTHKVSGAIFTVYNTLGFGHKEEIYQKSLSKEFTTLNIPFKQQVHLKVMYKNESVGNYRPDFLIEEKIILEIKAVEFMPKSFETQLLHYMKTTGVILGLLVNFGSTKLFIKRLIWTKSGKISSQSV